jgi:Xaa-Pro aminopeptidase
LSTWRWPNSKLKGIRLQRYDDRLEMLAEVMDRWEARRMRFEAEAIAHAEYLRWCDLLPHLHLLPADGLITNLRGKADPVELMSLRRAADLADAAGQGPARAAARRLRGEVAGEFARLLLGGGAERLAYLLVQFGRNTAQPQARPGQTVLQPGDLVLLDVAPVVGDATVTLARTVVVGEVDAEQRRAYSAVQQARFAALHHVRAGTPARLVDRAAREVITSFGFGRYFGHAIGRTLNGGPTIGPQSTRSLEEGMVISLGPGIYLPGWGGVRIEDTVVVHEHGCDILTYATTDLAALPVPVRG